MTAPTSDPDVPTLDLRRLNCPLPVLKTARALGAMAPGARLRVVATDPMAALDIPHFCNEKGHRLLSKATAGSDLVFLIERGGG